MRHAVRTVRLSRSYGQRKALLSNMARNVLQYGRVQTTLTKAKAMRPVIDRLIRLGKEGSIHSRRQAYRVLKDRKMVKRLFSELAPQYLDCPGGYTRVLKLNTRPGDGASLALLELTRTPAAAEPKASVKAKTPKPQRADAPSTSHPAAQEKKPAKPMEFGKTSGHPDAPQKKPKGFLEGLRERFRQKKSSSE